MTLTFEKDKRLLSAKDFHHVFAQPIKKIHSEHLLVLVRHNQKAWARLGLAISKKKLKNATDRNRLKRLIREHFRHQQCNMSAVDLVFVIKVGYHKDDSACIKTQLQDIFTKLVALYPSNMMA